MGIRYLDENNESTPTAKGTKIRYLDDETTIGDVAKGVGGVAMGALETVAAPFQLAGEAVRGAGESEPLQFATAEDPRGFRAPSVIQRIAPSLRTEKPPADVFTKAYQGLEGIANLPSGIETASEAVTREPGLIQQIGGMGLGLGVGSLAGSARKLPKMAKNVSKTLPKVPPVGMADDILKTATEVPPAGTAGRVENIFKTAPEVPPAGAAGMADDVLKSAEPPPPGAGKVPPGTPPAGKGPLDEVFETIDEEFGHAQKVPGLKQNLGKALERKGRGMRLKEVGAFPGQVRKLKDRFGEDLVNDLADLAESKGITKGFFNFQTGDAIKKLEQVSERQIGTLRKIATQRGAIHDKEALIKAIRAEFDPVYLRGTRSAQKGPYLKALQDIADAPADVDGMANKISQINRFIAGEKLTLPLNVTRKVMGAATRHNNELAGKFLNPQEMQLYGESLKDFSASKVFDKMYGYVFGRDYAGRTGPGSILNTIKDIGGRKIMEKVYTRLGRRWQGTPGGLQDPKALTAEVLDSVEDALWEIVEEMGSNPQSKAYGGIVQNMAYGGIVGEMDKYLTPKYGGAE